MRTFQAMAAMPAQRQGSIAAAIEEQHRLLAGLERGREGRHQRRREEALTLRPRAPHVDDAYLRQPRHAVPRRQMEMAIAAALDIDHGFERRRRRHQDDRNFRDRGAHHRHVARLIDHAVFLLERGVLLLVDDDEAEIGEGQEQRRARADHHARGSLGDRAPGIAPRRAAEIGMPFDRRRAETVGKAREPLRRERDLRQQHQHLAAAFERGGDGGEIDLGLARAGDAIEQRDGVTTGGDGGGKRGGGLGLRRRQRRTRPAPIRQRRRQRARQRDDVDQAGIGQRPHHTRTTRSGAREIRGGTRRPVFQHREHAPALLRQRVAAGCERGAAGIAQTIGGDGARRL